MKARSTPDALTPRVADKIVRSPLVTLDVTVEKAPPVVVELPNGAARLATNYTCIARRRPRSDVTWRR